MRDYDGHKMWIHSKLEGRAGEREGLWGNPFGVVHLPILF